uniref:Putative monolaris n=1 Tax=Rhipicephalus pulchellus TaxID=72859 RepID=L7MC33_RHIPC
MFRMPFPFLVCLIGKMAVVSLGVADSTNQVSEFCQDPYSGGSYKERCAGPYEREKRYIGYKNKCKQIFWDPCQENFRTYRTLAECLGYCAKESVCVKTPLEHGLNTQENKYHYYFDIQEGTCYSRLGTFQRSQKGENHFRNKTLCEEACSPVKI